MVLRPVAMLATILTLASCAGCCVPKSAYDASCARATGLLEQDRARQTELQTAQAEVRDLQSRLRRAESRLAAGDRAAEATAANGPSPPLPATVRRRLDDLARRYPTLAFDADTNAVRLDSDPLFVDGKTELTPAAAEVIQEFAAALRGAGDDCKIMVVGHTDDRGPRRPAARDEATDNWRLSASRAAAVADELRRLGVESRRIGVAGFADQHPLADNDSPENRRANRRVEIVLVPGDAPVVGWLPVPSTVRR